MKTVDFSEPKLHYVNQINKEFYSPSLVENSKEVFTYLKHADLQEGNMGAMITSSEKSRIGNDITKIKTIDLKSLVDLYGAPNFIKMDIEGEEYNVIEKSEDFIKKHPTKWFIEIHSPRPESPHKDWKYIKEIIINSQ